LTINLDKKSYENDLFIAYSILGSSCPPDAKGRNLDIDEDELEVERVELLRDDLDETNEAEEEYSFFRSKVIATEKEKVANNNQRYTF